MPFSLSVAPFVDFYCIDEISKLITCFNHGVGGDGGDGGPTLAFCDGLKYLVTCLVKMVVFTQSVRTE